MYFSVEDDELLENYNGINGVWNKASNSIKRELDWEHIYNKKIFENFKKKRKLLSVSVFKRMQTY